MPQPPLKPRRRKSRLTDPIKPDIARHCLLPSDALRLWPSAPSTSETSTPCVENTSAVCDSALRPYRPDGLQAEAEAARHAAVAAEHGAIRDQRLRDIEADRCRAAAALTGTAAV